MAQHYDFSEHTAQINDNKIYNLVKSNEKENTMDTFVSGLHSSIIHALMITGFVVMIMGLIEYQ